ncbi:MAG: 50S ribosomal protein L11 methyltransferase [Gemmatimonadota bacterium]|nr:50S ribosomal protein L11 methyltransferase [Gemmatimonadota bacterium]
MAKRKSQNRSAARNGNVTLREGDVTTLGDEVTRGLGDIRLMHPPGTTPITPASMISIEAIAGHGHLIEGIGIDWGSGGGCLSIMAARTPGVTRVVGLEIDETNVSVARRNARLNGVEEKVKFIRSGSYSPFEDGDRRSLESLRGRTDFMIANPISSDDDDGFGYRRTVLSGARDFLRDGGRVFLSISYQYGRRRIAGLERDVPGFFHEGILARSACVPFDLGRTDLLNCLKVYAREESRGGFEYEFCNPLRQAQAMNARDSLAFYERTGRSPLSQWQTHLFTYHPDRL